MLKRWCKLTLKYKRYKETLQNSEKKLDFSLNIRRTALVLNSRNSILFYSNGDILYTSKSNCTSTSMYVSKNNMVLPPNMLSIRAETSQMLAQVNMQSTA